MVLATEKATPRLRMKERPVQDTGKADQPQEARLALRNKRILIIGGTGSLGHELIHYLYHRNELAIFSRDEEKQWRLQHQFSAKEVKCLVGDIRDADSIRSALQYYQPEVVINAAALKQITTCEYQPFESIKTNILGVQHLVDAVVRCNHVKVVIGVSTDKACQPVNVYGMCKAIQERIYVEANLHTDRTRFVCVRYGNVLESRGSVIPLFKEQIRNGGPVTITLPHMTRFLLSLRQSVRLIMMAYHYGLPGDVWIPKANSATVMDIAEALIQGRSIPIKRIGIRPGEKIHETLISEEEVFRTIDFKNNFVIEPTLPELRRKHTHGRKAEARPVQFQRYSSKDFVLRKEETKAFLFRHGVI